MKDQQKRNMILFGDRVAKYHSVEGVDTQVKAVLNEDFRFHFSEDKALLTREQLEKVDLVFSYFEFGSPALSDEATDALLSYVSSGGGLIVAHNGISLQSRSEVCQMIGARFTGHPPYDTLPQISYRVTNGSHPIAQGVQDFTIGDEAYLFQLDPLAKLDIFLEYTYEGENLPAAWTREWGKGRVMHMMCGHNAAGFENGMVQGIIRNAALWCARKQTV